jgi:hypothetical protein
MMDLNLEIWGKFLIIFGGDWFLSRYQREDTENAAAGREVLNLVALSSRIRMPTRGGMD